VAEILQGLGVSTGVAVGRVLLLEPEALPVVPVPVPPERVEDEVREFERCRDVAQREIEVLRARALEALGENYAAVLDAQLLILEDPELVSETLKRIRLGRVSASWALKEVAAGFMRRFDAIGDGYLRERGGDLDDVHRRLQRLLRGGPSAEDAVPDGPLVLVAHTLGPSDAVTLSKYEIAGIATDLGGKTSHTAILAQALSLPAVVGLHDLGVRARTGDEIIVDGDAGEVLWLPDESEVERARARRQEWLERERELIQARVVPAVTRDGVKFTLRTNIEFPEQLDRALRYGAEGIGLYRSEFLFLARSPRLPTEEEHYLVYRELAEKVAPHPAMIRTLDLGGEKYFHQVLDHDEANPVLGLRAIRLCLQRPDIFLPQLRGLLRAAVHGNVHVTVPMVTVPEEVRQVRGLLHRTAEELRAEGIECREDVPLGIMMEVPAAAAIADLLAREVDFFSIGTNDLVQYALAADRGNESVAYLSQPLHPAVLRMIRFIVDSGREEGIGISLCGEMAADPSMTPLLVGLGLREFSVQPRALPTVRSAIQNVDASTAERLAGDALKFATVAEVERHLKQTG
jgi:phosphotransferase system enzyme I (PtsI)